ncbi:hypothetical protein O3P69_018229 [Scylla paramamosain]|uniref:Uncharacterized protein n=1 Tax=Scylla paramamosain TaxID=85552 RepID=A0AAW0TJ94_SCYPA
MAMGFGYGSGFPTLGFHTRLSPPLNNPLASPPHPRRPPASGVRAGVRQTVRQSSQHDGDKTNMKRNYYDRYKTFMMNEAVRLKERSLPCTLPGPRRPSTRVCRQLGPRRLFASSVLPGILAWRWLA